MCNKPTFGKLSFFGGLVPSVSGRVCGHGENALATKDGWRAFARSLLFLLAVVIVLLPAVPADAITYTVTDYGALPQGSSFMNISGISSSGVAVGTISSSVTEVGFVWSASSGYTYLTPLSGYTHSFAYGINDSGQVVGSSYSSASGQRASLWQGGRPVEDLGTLASGDSAAYAINSAGQIVGASEAGNGYTHAFLWSRSTGMQDLSGAASMDSSRAMGINDSGMVVGNLGWHAFVWTSSAGTTDLGVPIGADDVNNAGQILCNDLSFAFGRPASLWLNGEPLVPEIGFPTEAGGIAGCMAYDINNLGQVVGDGDQRRTFVWDATTGIRALPTASGLTYQYARAINDSGVIAGYGRDSAGIHHLLIWTPVPEPSSLLALLAGIGGFGALFRRRRR